MSDSDSGSTGSVAHAPKARKGQDGRVAKLRNRFEHLTSSAQPSSREAPAASSTADPSAEPPTEFRGSSLEHLSQRIRANNIVLHGVPDIAAHSRPADLTRYVSNKLDTATPRRGSPSQALSQSIRAAWERLRAVLVEFSTAKHEAFKLSPHLRRSGLHLADELTPMQLKAQKGLEADFSALKLKGFRPFYQHRELKYRARVSTGPARGGRQSECLPLSAPPGPLLPHLGLCLGALLLAVRACALHYPGSTAGGGSAPGQRAASCAATASTSAAIAAANAASAAAATAMTGNGDVEMPAPSPGPGAGPSALAPSQ
ncbi:TPA: hypothetical protein ACH3X1_009561 [Trebouxia sp. C0004]